MGKKKVISARLKEEKKIEALEEKELQSLQQLKREVAKDSERHPLTKITRADVIRSVIGALIGTVGHFAFFYGVELAERISIARATSLYILSLVVSFLFMYYSGFRKVKEVRIFRFIPLRVAIVYFISIAVVLVTLFLFGFINASSKFIDIYKIVATTLLLAVLGASTADILGKE
ncbi:MAG: DUF2391 family protein [Nanoarchaeota archaeon]